MSVEPGSASQAENENVRTAQRGSDSGRPGIAIFGHCGVAKATNSHHIPGLSPLLEAVPPRKRVRKGHRPDGLVGRPGPPGGRVAEERLALIRRLHGGWVCSTTTSGRGSRGFPLELIKKPVVAADWNRFPLLVSRHRHWHGLELINEGFIVSY
ncbi:unnamed protein product [Sphagnum tenellum]